MLRGQPYEKNAIAFPEESCNACHAVSAKDDLFLLSSILFYVLPRVVCKKFQLTWQTLFIKFISESAAYCRLSIFRLSFSKWRKNESKPCRVLVFHFQS